MNYLILSSSRQKEITHIVVSYDSKRGGPVLLWERVSEMAVVAIKDDLGQNNGTVCKTNKPQ